MKYRELLFIPVLIPFLTAERYRVWSWKAFVIVSAVTLLMSCLMNIGILDVNNQGDSCLKGRITHSIFIFLNFLMIGVQLGLLGLLSYIGFLASQFFCAKKLPDKEKWFAHGHLFSLVVTSLFNSPLLDHTEGDWFASMIALYFAPLQADIIAGIINA